MRNFQVGQFAQQNRYKSFQPNLINRKWAIDDMALLQVLGKADRELGRLDMYSEYIPNIDLFIQMHVLKEASQSSKIEGTQTNMEDALRDKEDIALDRRDDWEEVHNYVEAMNKAIDQLAELPFSSRLARDTHRTLLQGVRGEHKQPGEFRSSQNWIGGASIHDAIFIPPIFESIGELMGDIEHFVHDEDQKLPELLKIALIHYQFETIHPFLDGNGRVGRLLITLYLVSKGILKKPVLYLSDFFERNRTLYYDNLMRVREKNDLQQWFKFFLQGVIETAQSSIQTFDHIMQLQKDVDAKLQTLGKRSANGYKVMNELYQRPIMDAARLAKVAEISPQSAYKLLADFERLEILEEITGGKRGRLYLFSRYLDLFK